MVSIRGELMKKILSVLFGLLIFDLACATAWSQAGSTAQISGTVKDQSGAVLPGVEISYFLVVQKIGNH